jgi:hypothetical protein
MEAEQGGDGGSPVDQRTMEGALYTRAIRGRMGQHGWRHTRVGNGTARRGGRAAGWACARATQRHSDNERREGHVRGGNFVRTSVLGCELYREGGGRGHATCMGVPVHDAYVRLGSWAVT